MKYLFFGMLVVFLLFSCSQEEISLTDNYAVASSRTSTNIDTIVIVTNGIATSYYYDVNADTLIGNFALSDIGIVTFIDTDGDGEDDEREITFPGELISAESTATGGYFKCLKVAGDCITLMKDIASNNKVWQQP